MTDRELLDDDGENRAVRTFLQLYGGTNSPTVGDVRYHLAMSGFGGRWSDWAGEAHPDEHLTKGGAQSWLRYLFGLEQAASAAPAQEPQGWKLVPIEPTQEMINAGWEGNSSIKPTYIYRAMIAVAPTATHPA